MPNLNLLKPHMSDACYLLATTFTSLESVNLRAIYCYKLHFVKPVISLEIPVGIGGFRRHRQLRSFIVSMATAPKKRKYTPSKTVLQCLDLNVSLVYSFAIT